MMPEGAGGGPEKERKVNKLIVIQSINMLLAGSEMLAGYPWAPLGRPLPGAPRDASAQQEAENWSHYAPPEFSLKNWIYD